MNPLPPGICDFDRVYLSKFYPKTGKKITISKKINVLLGPPFLRISKIDFRFSQKRGPSRTLIFFWINSFLPVSTQIFESYTLSKSTDSRGEGIHVFVIKTIEKTWIRIRKCVFPTRSKELRFDLYSHSMGAGICWRLAQRASSCSQHNDCLAQNSNELEKN